MNLGYKAGHDHLVKTMKDFFIGIHLYYNVDYKV